MRTTITPLGPKTFPMNSFLRRLILACLLPVWTLPAFAQSGTGLTGKYYDTESFGTLKTTRTDATVDFNWGTAVPSGTALTSADTFSVVWSGRIEPEFSELYTFYLTVDDGARLWIDDQCLVARTFYQAPEELRAQIRLKAGHRVNIRVEYIESSGTAKAKLEWASTSQPRQVVPSARLYSTTEVPNGGSVIRETWTNIPGSSISSISTAPGFPNRPASRETLTSLECLARNWEDNYGTRITGWLRAPESGSYQFAVSGDDVVQFHLSTDSTTANKSIIAQATAPTAFRQWDAQPSQQSTPRNLIAGREYYFEVWHKESTGNDHFSIGWKKPGDASYSIISGTPLVMNNTKLTRPGQAAMFNTLSTEQPRILATKERFLWLKQQYEAPGSNPVKSRVQSIIDSANDALTAATIDDRAIESLATAWWVTGNAAYPERVWTDVEAVCTATGDWNYKFGPYNSFYVGIALDWLYPYWTASRRTTMANAIISKGSTWPTYTNNIGCDHISCSMVGALAVGELNESGAEALLNKAHTEGLPYIGNWGANGGGWVEGTMYAVLAKAHLGAAMAGMESALGSTWEFGNTAGFGLPAREQYYSKTNNGAWFTFSDIGTSSKLGWGWLNWWARRFEKGESWAISRSRGDAAENVLTLTDETSPDHRVTQPPPDLYFRGPIDSTNTAFKEIVTMRGNWDDPNATFVGTVGGAGSFAHGMLEDGTFQINARGKSWFSNLSSDDYEAPGYFDGTANANSPYRWDYYRCRAEGHNTLVINPGSGPDRVVSGVPIVLNHQSSAYGDESFSVLNMTPTITGATRVNRGIKLFNKREQVLVQDEIVMPTASTVWWFAHYGSASTTIDIAADGKSATMTKGSERLWLKILSAGTFTDMAATPLPTSPVNPYNDPNTGYRKLAINLTNVTNSTLAVWFVPLAPGDPLPTTSPAVTALNSWSLSAANSAPTASDATVSSETLTTDIDLSAYVSDDWTFPRSIVFAVGNAQGGTVTLLPDGRTARFVQPQGATGPLGFTFTATDEGGLVSNTGSVQVGITPVGHVWTSLTSGNWSDAAKWSGGKVPASNPAVRIEFLTGLTPGSTAITTTNNIAGILFLNSLVLAGNGASSTVTLAGGSLAPVSNGITPPAFRATSPAGSTWNVGSSITLGEALSVSNDASSLNFTGSISGPGSMSISGGGPVAITGSSGNTFSGETALLGGAALTLGKSSGINSIGGNITVGDASGPAVLTLNQSEQIANTSIVRFNSGQGSNSSTLRIVGGKTETIGGLETLVAGQSPVIEGSGAGTATLIVNNASNFEYDGILRNGTGGTLALTKQGSGTLTLRNALAEAATEFTGATTISAGSLALTSEPGAAGLRRVIENWNSNISNSGTLILNNSSGSENFTKLLTGSGSLAKSGAGSVVLPFIQTYTGATTVSGGTLLIPAGGGYNRTTAGALQASSGGTFQYDSPVQSRFSSITVGSGSGGRSTLVQTAGTLLGTSLTLNSGFTGSGPGNVNLSGGLLSITGNANLSSQVAGDNIWSTVTVSGYGTLSITGTLFHTGNPSAGRYAAGRVVQIGGTVTVTGPINLARTTAGNTALRRGEYNLDGGVLTVSQITEDVGTDTFGTFNFNGGTLKPSANSLVFLQGLNRANIRNGGALIDTNGSAVTIAQDLLHSDISGDDPSDGGFTKSGAGKLTLTGNNSYNGDTTINAGTLSLATVNPADDQASMVIATGATLELTHGAAETVGRLFIGNAVQPAGTYEAVGNPGSGTEIPQITGSGQLIVTASTGAATWNTTSGSWSTGPTNWTGVIGTPWNGLNGPITDALINVTLNGAPTVTGTVYAKAITVGKTSALTISGSGSIQSTGALMLGSAGTAALNHNSTATSTFGTIIVGNGTGNSGTLNLTSGTIQATALTLSSAYSSGMGTVVIGGASGPAASMNISGNSIVSVASSGATSTLTVGSTGSLSVTGSLGFCTNTSRDANGRIVQSGGSVTAASLSLSGNVSDGAAVTHTSVYDLDGGALTVGSITSGTVTTTGTINSTFNFNGGTLRPSADSSSFWPARTTTTANIKNGGANIDTNGKNITIAQPLVPFARVVSAPLAKSGAGTLTLSGTHTYNGPTSILGGTLALASGSSISASSAVRISPGAVWDVAALPSIALAASQPVTFRLDGNGAGSSGRIQAAGLNIGNANVIFEITAPLDDTVYVLATYTSKTGSSFASVSPPAGYALNYSYNGNQIALVTTSGFSGWISGFPNLIDITPTGDSDRDGVANLLEYVLNGNPGTSDPAILPDLDVSGTNFVFTFIRRELSANDTTQVFQHGSSIAEWTNIPIVPSASVAILPNTPSAGLQQVTVTIPKGSNARIFGRLKASIP